ncbi:helix-turn-helix domain-containing protein [Sphaerisporangium dianthi]|uniref:Helix-turn-helix domain-containing protein n=1 Tax=Sphaerisporangium dianthi TaxID=1436120 RepID=A0ABV9CK19_9ACTN
MRYAHGGGLSAEERDRRERLRLQAVELFAEGMAPARVARRFRVSRMSASRWHRARRQGGEAALGSKGAGGEKCRLDEPGLARLAAELGSVNLTADLGC